MKADRTVERTVVVPDGTDIEAAHEGVAVGVVVANLGRNRLAGVDGPPNLGDRLRVRLGTTEEPVAAPVTDSAS